MYIRLHACTEHTSCTYVCMHALSIHHVSMFVLFNFCRNILSPGYHSDESASKGSFSSLYVYNISTNEWKQLRFGALSA